MANWTQDDIPEQSGHVVIVTGANSGLGYETTLALAKKNATVVVAARNMSKGKKAQDDILAQVSNADLHLMQLDLGDLASVRTFANEFQAKFERLDILINNAGIMAIPRSETTDGFETQFGVNHLGHFALTGLLIEILMNTANSRVVSVSSSANYFGNMNFDDLMGEQDYSRYGAYCQSKLANVVFANELQKRLTAMNADMISLSAHPGLSHTNLQSTSTDHSGSVIESILYPIMMNTMAQSQAMGALPQLFAATAPQANGCDFIGPNFMGLRGYPKKVRANKDAYDETIAKRLWEASEALTGVRYTALEQAAASI